MTRLSNPAAFGGKTKSVDMTADPVRFTLQDNGNITARFKLDNGNFFSIDTGLDRNGLVERAVNVLNRTAPPAQPHVGRPRVEKKADDDEIGMAINEIETGSASGVISNEDLLEGLRDVFAALRNAKGPDRRRALRSANMEDVVKALQQALDRARHLDDRNTKLINEVREVFYGNPQINTDNLLKEISDVLNKKRVNPKDKIDENIRNKIEDDLDENLNINAWLGEDGPSPSKATASAAHHV